LQMIGKLLINLLQANLVDVFAPFDNGRSLLHVTILRCARCRIWCILNLVERLRALHEARKQSVCVMLHKGGVEKVKHFLIGSLWGDGRSTDGILLNDVNNWRQQLVHSLTVATPIWIDFAVDKDDV